MSRGISWKVVLVVVLIAAAVFGGYTAPNAVTIGLLALGIANVLLSTPGTAWVRGITILVTVGALASPDRNGIVALLWFLWPPAYLLARAIGSDDDGPEEDPARIAARSRARISVASMIVATAVAALAYQIIVKHGLQQTAVLFVGIPAIFAIIVVFAVSPRSATGVACKAVTIGLLVSLFFLGEGMLCILMSAPLFYGIAIVIAEGIEYTRRYGRRSPRAYSCLAVLVLAPLSLEGMTDETSLSRDEWVTETRIVHASSSDVEAALFTLPRFDRTLPHYLRMGFPRPTLTRAEHEGDALRWVIRFRGGETHINGMEPREGDLVLELQTRRPGLVTWQATTDSSHMTHFLNWREARVEWTPIDAQSTQVTWSLRYRRGLDPAWYFGPWERYATHLAAGYLIESVATP